VDRVLAARVDALRPFVALALRYPKLESLEDSREQLEAVGNTAAALCKHAGVNVVLFPTHLSGEFVDDRPVMDRLEGMLVGHGIASTRITRASWQSLDDAAHWVQSAAMVFGDRLHAMLVAALNHVPVAGVAVEDKISGCLSDLFKGEPFAVVLAPGDVSKPGARQSVLDLWDWRGADTARYARLLAEYRMRRKVNIAAIERALGIVAGPQR
jgi:polysaccharide pyruvyl transferase WcaK-like protein